MGKLLDADKVEAELRRLAEVWRSNESTAWVLGVLTAWVADEDRFDAPEELQPKPPRQTLVEALDGAEVGTRFRHKQSSTQTWAVLIAPGRIYNPSTGKERPTTDNYRRDNTIKYADEFIIEYPTY